MDQEEKRLGQAFEIADAPTIPNHFIEDFLRDPAVQELADSLKDRGFDADRVEQYLIGLYRGGEHKISLAEAAGLDTHDSIEPDGQTPEEFVL